MKSNSKPLKIVAAIVLFIAACTAIQLGLQQLRGDPDPRPLDSATSPDPLVSTSSEAGKSLQPPELDLTDVDHAIVAAIREAETAVRAEPDSAAAWGKLGMVLLAHEFDEPAAECLARAATLDPKEPRWPYFQGLSHVRHNPAAAVPLVARAADLCGNDPLAPRLRLFELYFELDRVNEIEPELRKFLDERPENTRAHLVMARIELRRGKLDECLRELKLAESHRAAQKPAHELRAEVYNRQGRTQDAEAERRLAAGLPSSRWPDPFHDEIGQLRTGLKVALTRADRLFVAGKPLESIAVIEQALVHYPQSDWAWIILARAQIRLRRLDQAEASLKRALAITPDSADALFRMGVVYSLTGRTKEAATWFGKVLDQKPDHPVAWYNLGHGALQLKKPAQAIEYFRKAISCQADYYDAHIALGDLLAKEGQPNEARKVFTQALKFRPEDHALKERLDQLPAAKR
jgi:tetratricopeptide (TPR) repeat protein